MELLASKEELANKQVNFVETIRKKPPQVFSGQKYSADREPRTEQELEVDVEMQLQDATQY